MAILTPDAGEFKVIIEDENKGRWRGSCELSVIGFQHNFKKHSTNKEIILPIRRGPGSCTGWLRPGVLL